MGNEIFAIILWAVSIPVAWGIAFLLMVTVVGKMIDNAKEDITDSLFAAFKMFWPAIVLWVLYAIWVIVAVVNIIVHIALAVQIGTGVIPGA